jgi:hypothetical protein
MACRRRSDTVHCGRARRLCRSREHATAAYKPATHSERESKASLTFSRSRLSYWPPARRRRVTSDELDLDTLQR